MEYLKFNGVQWEWVDPACDHILIDGHIDYYLGKTYWSDRKTVKSGYAMLKNLLKKKAVEKPKENMPIPATIYADEKRGWFQVGCTACGGKLDSRYFGRGYYKYCPSCGQKLIT